MVYRYFGTCGGPSRRVILAAGGEPICGVKDAVDPAARRGKWVWIWGRDGIAAE
jgi:hypothetical protein